MHSVAWLSKIYLLQIHAFYFPNFIYLFLIRERGREGEKEGEKHQYVVASWVPSTGDLACNPGTCPGWESNWWPFGLQTDTQSTEPHQPGMHLQNFFVTSSQISFFSLNLLLCSHLTSNGLAIISNSTCLKWKFFILLSRYFCKCFHDFPIINSPINVFSFFLNFISIICSQPFLYITTDTVRI